MPNKKLEVENKLMEERLNQLKNEFIHDREKRKFVYDLCIEFDGLYRYTFCDLF